MQKIQTIFKRDWEKSNKVINEMIDGVNPNTLETAKATEKIDGTNVRITVRKHYAVRVEKRRNPSKQQKVLGIEEPWYVDANESDSSDKWIYDGIRNIDFSDIPDGEWSGELVGPNIQGNPLNLDKNVVVFFTLDQCPVHDNVPVTFEELKEWLPKQKSKYGKECFIEGIVWHCKDGRMFKIKTKDFDYKV
jgi:hypothetical protein